MNCKNCGAPLEDGQTVCGVCGAQNEAGIPAAEEPVTAPPAEENPTPAEETPVPAVEIPAPAEDNPAPAAEVSPAMTIPVSAVEPIPKKKGKGGLIAALVIAAVLIAGAVLAALNWNTVSGWGRNFIAKTFSSPEEYYRAVETENMKGSCDALRQIAAAADAAAPLMELQNGQYREGKAEYRFNIEALGRELQDLLQDEAGVDISWLHNFGLYESVGKNGDGVIGGMATLFLNDHDLLSAGYALDPEGKMAYLQVPMISEQYAYLDLAEIRESLGDASLTLMNGGATTRIDPAALADVAERAAAIFVSHITEAEKGSAALTAGGLSKSFDTITVHADGETLRDIAVELLDLMQNDSDMQEIFRGMLGVRGMAEGEIPDYLRDALTNMQESLAETKQELLDKTPEELTQELTMTLYLNNMGRIVGRDVELRDGETLLALVRGAAVAEGDSFGFRLDITEDDGEEWQLLLEGSGVRGGGELTASMSASARDGDEELWKLFELDAAMNRSGDGVRLEMLLTPSEELTDRITEDIREELPEAAVRLIHSLRLKLGMEGKAGNTDITVGLLNDSEELLAFCMKIYAVQPFEVSIPADAIDIQDWADAIDYGKIMKLEQDLLAALTEAGMPMSVLYGAIG